jgi:hypothetical protein
MEDIMRLKLAVTMAVLACAASLVGANTVSGTVVVTTTGSEPCCFENPRYSGTCQVTPGPDESCGEILSYLNTPNSVGKGYCGNTPIRGGWSQVPCSGDVAAGTMTCESDPAVD